MVEKPTGLELIAQERKRQIEVEGFTTPNDTRYINKELFRAACAYELNDRTDWPWSGKWWKPEDDIVRLTKAGALYQAYADVLNQLGAMKNYDSTIARVIECANKIDEILANEAKNG